MYSDIHMISYSRGNALTKKGPKINRIPDDSSHTPNNLRSDRPLLMRSLLRMASKEHIQDILPMLFPTTALAGRKWNLLQKKRKPQAREVQGVEDVLLDDEESDW
ncbi:hypothetical protein ACHAPA_008042 [Fusarium lateritium]